MPIRLNTNNPVAEKNAPKEKKKSAKSVLEEKLSLKMRVAGIPEPKTQYHFAAEHVGRGKGIRDRLKEVGLKDWRFDFCWPQVMLAVEVDGGIWMSEHIDKKTGKPKKGGHTTGRGYEENCVKINAAEIMGWHVLRFTPGHVRGGYAIEMIQEYFNTCETEEED